MSHLQFEAVITAGRESANINDYALVAMLGLLGLPVFEATGASITDLSEARGHHVLTVHGKGNKVALVPLPPAVARAVDRATEERQHGPILLNTTGRRHGPSCCNPTAPSLAQTAGVSTARMHPHMLRHTLVTTMLDA